MKLKVIIEKDESGYFTAEVPALPGCFSQGNTVKEAKENIREAISGWFEVMNEKKLAGKKEFFEEYEELLRLTGSGFTVPVFLHAHEPTPLANEVAFSNFDSSINLNQF